MFKGLFNREKKLLYICALCLIFAVTYRILIVPALTKFRTLNVEIEKAQLKLRKGMKAISCEKKITREYKVYKKYMMSGISKEKQMSKLLKDIEQIASKAHINVMNLKPREVKDFDFYKKYLVELNIEGDVQAIIKFIYDLRRSSGFLKEQKISLSAKKQDVSVLKGRLLISKIILSP